MRAWSCLLLAATACQNPAAGKRAALIGPPAPDPAPRPAAPGELLLLGPGNTRIGFVGSKVTGSNHGGFARFAGALELHGGAPAASRVTVDIDMTSVWTDASGLTRHLKTPAFFDVARHPAAHFRSTEIQAAGASRYWVTGNLELRGVTRSIRFLATIAVTGDGVAADSEFSLDRHAFGVSYPGRADDLIRPEVVLTLSVRAPRPGFTSPAGGNQRL